MFSIDADGKYLVSNIKYIAGTVLMYKKNWSVSEIDTLFLDRLDYRGLLWWFDRAKEAIKAQEQNK